MQQPIRSSVTNVAVLYRRLLLLQSILNGTKGRYRPSGR
jgi:hypothetical protein